MSVFLSKMHHYYYVFFSLYISVMCYAFCDYDNKITLALISIFCKVIISSYNLRLMQQMICNTIFVQC